ncbi:glycosyltransferase [Akkermansiaceae bacterium]|nr:glycosyltransferase [Akkermansiaceae bacterium]
MNATISPSPGEAAAGRIHILQLVTSLEPGGLENGVVNLANGLDPARFRTSVACLERVGDFAGRLGEGIGVTCLGKAPGFRFSAARMLARTVRSESIDIIHSHNLGPLIYGALASVLAGGRAVLLQGEHGQLRPDEMTAKRKWLRQAGYGVCGGVHAVSGGLRDDLVSHGFPGTKIRVILNGVDCARFTPVSDERRAALRGDWGLCGDSIVVGIVGRFVALKGHERLIGAFEQLAPDHPRLRLLIVGDHGPERERILGRIKGSAFADRIAWSGYQPETVDFYRMMDLLVVPSESEGLSNVMLESMACGIPCLAHPACGASEVIADGENGLLRDMSTSQGLASALGGIAFNPSLLGDLGVAARQTAVERFSLAAMIAGYASLYEELVRDKRALAH